MNAPPAARRLVGAALGLLADRLVGEPPAAWHPVARFGQLMTRVEASLYTDTVGAGVAYALAGLSAGVAAGVVAGSTTLAVGCSAAGRMLRSTARDVGDALAVGDVDRARALLPTLVGRDPAALDEAGVAAAAIESLAENTVDAVVAPALFGAAFGAPGAAAHRAVNTMDAMVGHHSDRYERFGRVGARLDDVAAFVPARVTAALVCAARPARARAVVRAVRRDAPAHPSPNAGVAEAAFAAALDVELGGPTPYAGRVDNRPCLGGGPRPGAADIERAIQLADRVELSLTVTLGALGVALTTYARGEP